MAIVRSGDVRLAHASDGSKDTSGVHLCTPDDDIWMPSKETSARSLPSSWLIVLSLNCVVRLLVLLQSLLTASLIPVLVQLCIKNKLRLNLKGEIEQI